MQRRLIGLGSVSLGLAAAALAGISPMVTEVQPRIDGEWAPKPAHEPKRGKPTKAEKKAAKRARTRGAGGPNSGTM